MKSKIEDLALELAVLLLQQKEVHLLKENIQLIEDFTRSYMYHLERAGYRDGVTK